MDDLIKRQDAIDSILFATADVDKADWVIGVIKSVPSAQRTGHWIHCKYPLGECSECHAIINIQANSAVYCPVCGCRIENIQL